jgi:multidrug resistance protein
MDGTRPDATSKWIVLGVVGSGIFMVTLDSGMLNVALPTLTRDFNEPVTATQWVVLAYLLCVTALLLPIGRLADMVGRKRVFLGGFIVFTIGSALCGLAPSLWLLVAARVLQGIGGAMVQANGAGLVTQAFPASERGRALGLNGAIVSAGLLSGPVIGGLITNWFSWHWLFFVNIPIGIVATIFGFQRLREPPLQAGQRFDAAGAITFLLFVASLLLTLNRAIQSGWADPVVAGLLALTVVSGAVLALALGAWKQAMPMPIISWRRITSRMLLRSLSVVRLRMAAAASSIPPLASSRGPWRSDRWPAQGATRKIVAGIVTSRPPTWAGERPSTRWR